MRLFLAIVLSGLFVAPASAGFLESWTLSGSATDPYQNSDTPAAGVRTLYLWFTGFGPLFEFSTAEMGLSASGAIFILTVIPTNGFVVTGTSDALVIHPPDGCVAGIVLAAQVLVFDTVGGAVCFAPSSVSGANCMASCSEHNRLYWENSYIGFSTDGSPPCQWNDIDLCNEPAVGAPAGVGPAAWGRVKASYR